MPYPTHRRPRSMTPEDRAARLTEPGYSPSGNNYVTVQQRWDGEYGKVPYYPNRRGAGCDHGVSICSTWECVESWSMDHKVLLAHTGAGREIAERLGIDASRFAEHQRTGIEILDIEDFRPQQPATV